MDCVDKLIQICLIIARETFEGSEGRVDSLGTSISNFNIIPRTRNEDKMKFVRMYAGYKTSGGTICEWLLDDRIELKYNNSILKISLIHHKAYNNKRQKVKDCAKQLCYCMLTIFKECECKVTDIELKRWRTIEISDDESSSDHETDDESSESDDSSSSDMEQITNNTFSFTDFYKLVGPQFEAGIRDMEDDSNLPEGVTITPLGKKLTKERIKSAKNLVPIFK